MSTNRNSLPAEIQVLSTDVINQIAAGEVVERPAHLIKELVENSIDAGASEVLIEVSLGGRNIKVKDNGRGIHKDELPLALERHATSKITTSDDLFRLVSYGFRGEALASIAAVSELTLMSHKKSATGSFQIKSYYGELSEVLEGSVAEGTEVLVRRLFENTPARLKFLKSASAELTQIKAVIKAMALSHPYVQLKLIVDGDLQLFFQAVKPTDEKSLENRYRDILGVKKIFLSAREHRFGSDQKIKCEVAFTAPNEVAKTSKNTWVFVQNRWIQDRTITAAVMDSFRTLLMHGEYPQVALFLSTPADFVDVNISPTKSQVKFVNSSEVYRAVQSTLREALSESPWFRGELRGSQPGRATPQNSKIETYQFQPPLQNQSFFSDEPTVIKKKDFLMQSSNVETTPFNFASSSSDPVRAMEKNHWSSFHVVGQFDLTYIVCQKDDLLILVDQHAAHERVAFEKLMQKWQGGDLDIQSFLFPLQINLNEAKVEALFKHESQLLKMGLEFERLGPESIGVKSAPALIKEKALQSALEKMAQELVDFGDSYQFEKSVTDIFATMACHSVVRAGQSLSFPEMQELLFEMDQFPFSSFCPHGRPVFIQWNRAEVERLFGRRN